MIRAEMYHKNIDKIIYLSLTSYKSQYSIKYNKSQHTSRSIRAMRGIIIHINTIMNKKICIQKV